MLSSPLRQVVHDPLVPLEVALLHGEEVELVRLAGGQVRIGVSSAGSGRRRKSSAGPRREEELVLARLHEDAAAARLEVAAVFRQAQVDARAQAVAQAAAAQVVRHDVVAVELQILGALRTPPCRRR